MILLILILLIAIGFLIAETTDYTYTGHWIVTLSVVALIIALPLFGVLRIETATIPSQREALQHTYEMSRDFSEFERATITVDIAEFNRHLSIYKYWNETWLFGVFIDPNVREVELIR